VSAPVTVRPLRWSDFDDLRENYFHLYEERARGISIGISLFREKPTVAQEVDWFAQQFRQVTDGLAVGSVAEVDGRAVGSCFVAPRQPGSELDHVGELGILVHESHRGQGVGTALLTDALSQCRGRFDSVYLAVFATNEGAKRLYARFGFVLCGRLPRTIKRGAEFIDLEWMALRL